MKLWIDDLRTPPDDTWLWAKTSSEALTILRSAYLSLVGLAPVQEDITAVSFDHDLGGDDTTRPVIMWMAEYQFWPEIVYVHSMNVIGAEYIMGVAENYSPENVDVIRVRL